MTSPEILGRLASLHELTAQLIEAAPAADAARQYHPELGSLAWYFARSVYLETYWLREVILGDDRLTRRVAHLFTPGSMTLAEQCAALPPRDHLLNWAAEIRDQHLMTLANPGSLPPHPLLDNERLQRFVLQEHGRSYECMLAVLQERILHQRHAPEYRAGTGLTAAQPSPECALVEQGHYRIGARHEPYAYDNELPPQVISLSAFRIATRPASNTEWLAFIEQGGYAQPSLWSEQGWRWRSACDRDAPRHWRRDAAGHWYGMGISGPADLLPADPVTGISRHEAQAYACWAAGLGGALEGAALQHEYQWETAVRIQAVREFGRAWEWCANCFAPYSNYAPPPKPAPATADFDGRHFSLRGGCLHTQRELRRASFRHRALPHQDFLFAGLRLIFPPE